MTVREFGENVVAAYYLVSMSDARYKLLTSEIELERLKHIDKIMRELEEAKKNDKFKNDIERLLRTAKRMTSY